MGADGPMNIDKADQSPPQPGRRAASGPAAAQLWDLYPRTCTPVRLE